MARLLKKQDKLFIANLITAKNFKQRAQGLIGKTELKPEEAFYLPCSSSVHTFFMKFPIDVIFTNTKFVVQKVFKNTPANKILIGGFKILHAFEFKAGQTTKHNLKKGDLLYVEH